MAALAPAFGIIKAELEFFIALIIPIATPEWTVPIITSTLSLLISLLTFSAAFDGFDSSSKRINSNLIMFESKLKFSKTQHKSIFNIKSQPSISS